MPTVAPPVVGPALVKGFGGLGRGLGVLAAGAALVVLLRLPGQWIAARTVEDFTHAMDAMQPLLEAALDGGAIPTPEALSAGAGGELGSAGSAVLGAGCGQWALELLVITPLFAGLSIAGVRADSARGVRAADLAAGFRRWLAVVLSGFIALLAGAGYPVLSAALPMSLGLGALGHAVGPSGAVAGGCCFAVLLLLVLWLSTRLWFATVRAADPARPPIDGLRAVMWSWKATSRLQGGLFVLAVLALCACGIGIPAMLLAQEAAPPAWQAMARVCAAAAAECVVLPPLVACAGAAYHIVASHHEPIDGVAVTRAPNGPP